MNTTTEELLFTAACAFDDPKERTAFLNYACQNDPALRERLKEMLDFNGEAATFFEFQPRSEPSGEAPAQRGEEGIGAHIGRYKLIRRIGAGGCGVVYSAVQEVPVRRKVALKIVRLGMNTEAIIGRFELERQALAQMDHPNIARVLDAGATASGRPYFVMELVEGEKITDFCDANSLDIRTRLELFVLVCRAIQHAHQKRVIHRDIKPSNILVHMQDGLPVPKVIDFGIAKATAPNMEGEATFTQFGQFIGTPAYMSPEQLHGSVEADTRSDIYSLGVLLYELLSGQIPFDLKRFPASAEHEVRRIIREEEPKRPSAAFKMSSASESAAIAASRRTSVLHLSSQLAGDLDWIVMKALEKERSRRYDSATGLAMEVLRYVNQEPVLARPPSRGYLLGKLVRRNRLVFLAGGIAVFGLLAGFGTSTWMYFQERAERQRAEYRELIAHAAVRIKYGDLAGADKLLAEVPFDQTPSSLEAAEAFSAVADWHMLAWQLPEAAARYSSMIRAIASIDNSDLPAVSINLLPATASVAFADGAQPYEEIRRMAINRFGSTSQQVVAEQTLKACLLLPADRETLQSLTPLANFLEQAVGHLEAKNNGLFPGYVYFALALTHYRAGEYPQAAEWAKRCLDFPNKTDARTAAMLIVRAMIEQKQGQSTNARVSLAQGRAAVESAFAKKEWVTMPDHLYWVDWFNAAILLREAEQLIGSQQSQAREEWRIECPPNVSLFIKASCDRIKQKDCHRFGSVRQRSGFCRHGSSGPPQSGGVLAQRKNVLYDVLSRLGTALI
jgi:serine/threonine protein kinase